MRSTVHLPAMLALLVGASQPAAWATPQAGAGQGMTVVRDADTGELRAPTSAERQALQTAAPASAVTSRQSPPTVVTGPDGRRNAQLGESRLVYSVVTRGPDGKLDQTCVHGAHAAERIVNGGAPAHEKGRHDHR